MTGQLSKGLSRSPSLLGIYLNDHLAGATGGVELARRIAAEQRGTPAGGAVRELASDIAQDRAALVSIMKALGIPVRQYKIGLGWAGEKVGRLKLNGYLAVRSPLSSLEELELMRLGAEGKAAGWRTLRALADSDSRVDARQLDDLLGRATAQVEILEDLRVKAASEIIGREQATGQSGSV
ncbi:MAG: hypothetical protein ACRDRJ_16995 [Streptosporangiaceae bacterium]